MTQLSVTRDYIKLVGEISNYHLSQWGSGQGWVGDSARRKAFELLEKGEVHHPEGNKHIWKWGCGYKVEKSGQEVMNI